MIRRTSILLLLSAFCSGAQQAGPPEDVPMFRAATRLVEAYVSVLDKRGNPIPNLSLEKFTVLDNGKPQTLVAFEGAEDKLSCALLLDITGSMEEFLPVLKNSVLRFIDDLPADQELAIYTFSNNVQLAQDFTSDKRLTKQAVMRVRSGGATALFDAAARVSRDLEMRKGKKALVLFTDGNDNASSLTSNGASRRAKLAGVPVYAIAQGEALRNRQFMQTLEDIASDTGGLALTVKKPTDITSIFAAISQSLKHTYLFSWKMPDDAGTEWRNIQVLVPGIKDATVRARQGYTPNYRY